MKKAVYILLPLLMAVFAAGCRPGRSREQGAQSGRLAPLEDSLNKYIEGKDARIGIAVILDGKDTVAVNGGRDFPMLSVYKFPQAIAVADFCRKNGMTADSGIDISAAEILPDTWSPMREKYGVRDLRLPLSELLAFSLQQSDNNACDILFRLIGGPAVADSVMKAEGFPEIVVGSTEKEMHDDIYLSYQNRSTPVGMARLFDAFFRGNKIWGGPASKTENECWRSVIRTISQLSFDCETGINRLPAPLVQTEARIAHKTGTGDRNSQGRIIGVNDAGYISLPDGRGYAIAVFIADSAYSQEVTEQIIGDISSIVYNWIAEETPEAS